MPEATIPKKRSDPRLLLEALRSNIPEGKTLPENDWRVRHRAILFLIWFHSLGLAAFGVYVGYRPLPTVFECSLIGALALAAAWGRVGRSLRSAIASVGLVTSSAVLVQLSGGYIEAHFHFFVMLVIIALYEDWVPYLVAIVFVAVEHGLTGQFVPTWVYNHPDGFIHPWKWALIHAGFVLSESAALLVGWLVSERARRRADLFLNSAGEGIVGLDLDGRITFANPAAADLTGYPAGVLVGRKSDQILLPANGIPADKTADGFLSSGNGHARSAANVLLHREGNRIPVYPASNPIRKRDRIVGSVVTLRDETLREQAEEQSRNLSRLNATLESTADGILVVDREGKITSFNLKLIEMWNVPPSVFTSRDKHKILDYLPEQLKDPEGFLKSVRDLSDPAEAEGYDILEFNDGRIFERYSQP